MTIALPSKLKLRDGKRSLSWVSASYGQHPIDPEANRCSPGTYELDGEEAYSPVRYLPTFILLYRARIPIIFTGWVPSHRKSRQPLTISKCEYNSLRTLQNGYGNEAQCGRAIREFCARTGTPREAIFYTTKLKTNSGFAATKAAIQRSLDKCSLGYIDLYLMHSPIGGPEKRRDCWKAIMEARAEGKIRSIGVSNYGVKHLQEMVDARVELPVINQVDLHPFMTRTDIVAFCNEHDIALEAWAPLVRGLRFRHPSLRNLSKKYNKEPAQILLRYSLQKGYIPLPKSSSRVRIESNIKVYDFELTSDEVAALDALDEGMTVHLGRRL
ncbi:putative oxidoreductase C2F3.05c, partial [Grifola frondosa]